MIKTIIEEMTRGNFSFLILLVGVLQLILMWKNYTVATRIKDDEEYYNGKDKRA